MPEKICRICGEDCSSRPRIKDPRGRYFCKSCYEQARTRRRSEEARAEPAAVADEADPEATPDAGLEVPGESRRGGICPGCNHPVAIDAVLCTNCGYNLSTGERLDVPAVESGGPAGEPAPEGLAQRLKTPAGSAGTALALLLVLLIAATQSEIVAIVYVLASILFIVAVGLAVLVTAARHGLGQFLLTLLVPFYALYFVFKVSESLRLQTLFAASLISGAALYVAMSLALVTLPAAMTVSGPF